MSTSIPPEESTSHVHDSPVGARHTVLSVLEQATSREGRPDSTPVSTVIGTAHNMLHRLTSSSPSTPHAHDTPSPEALLDAAAASATPTVLGDAQNMISRLTSSSAHHASPHATPALPPQTQKPVPDVPPQEQPVEVLSPTEGPQQRGAEPLARVSLLPDRSRLKAGDVQIRHHVGLRVSRGHTQHYLKLLIRHAPYAYPTSIAAQPDPMPTVKRHGIPGMTEILYVRSPMIIFRYHERLIVLPGVPSQYREKTVGQRIDPTVTAARTELSKAKRKGE